MPRKARWSVTRRKKNIKNCIYSEIASHVGGELPSWRGEKKDTESMTTTDAIGRPPSTCRIDGSNVVRTGYQNGHRRIDLEIRAIFVMSSHNV